MPGGGLLIGSGPRPQWIPGVRSPSEASGCATVWLKAGLQFKAVKFWCRRSLPPWLFIIFLVSITVPPRADTNHSRFCLLRRVGCGKLANRKLGQPEIQIRTKGSELGQHPRALLSRRPLV